MELDGNSCRYYQGLRSKHLSVRSLISGTIVQVRHIRKYKIRDLERPK